jgi:hypothetical protein
MVWIAGWIMAIWAAVLPGPHGGFCGGLVDLVVALAATSVTNL